MARRRASGEMLIKIGMVVLFLMFVWSMGTGADANSRLGDGPYQVIHVSRGDTLWSIAAKNVGDKEDIRNLVVSIRKLNNLGNDVQIHPGQVLKVPLKTK